VTIEEALKEINGLPGSGVIQFGFERIETLLALAGNPHKSLRFVHIAGTNGKGSVAAMLAAILTKAGYRTGLFTSPAIHAFNEQICIDGVPATDAQIAESAAFFKPHAEAMPELPTSFEFETAIAFDLFRRGGCALVFLETGLGGRLDSTNIIDPPEVAVLTAISLDHTKLLGETLEQIAFEKAGIIKKNTDVVLYQQSAAVETVVEKKCRAENARLHPTDFSDITPVNFSLEGQTADFPGYPALFIPLHGAHQRKNALVALTTVAVLRQKGYRISEHAVREGFQSVVWPARFELLNRAPIVLLDGGHNPACMRALYENLSTYFPGKKISFIVGVFADKSYAEMMTILAPAACHFYTVTPNHPRALPSEALSACLAAFHLPVDLCDSVADGIQKARANAQKDDVLCITGSLSIAGEARAVFGRNVENIV
jgi:dihydrofolate synthase/folylpolyglutamate synthase